MNGSQRINKMIKSIGEINLITTIEGEIHQ